jgi:hypothetical protein
VRRRHEFQRDFSRIGETLPIARSDQSYLGNPRFILVDCGRPVGTGLQEPLRQEALPIPMLCVIFAIGHEKVGASTYEFGHLRRQGGDLGHRTSDWREMTGSISQITAFAMR